MAGCISGTLESCRWSSGAGRYAVEKKNRWAENWPHICSLGEHEEEFSAGDRHSHLRTPKVPLWTRESCDGRPAACSRVRDLRTRALPRLPPAYETLWRHNRLLARNWPSNCVFDSQKIRRQEPLSHSSATSFLKATLYSGTHPQRGQ